MSHRRRDVTGERVAEAAFVCKGKKLCWEARSRPIEARRTLQGVDWAGWPVMTEYGVRCQPWSTSQLTKKRIFSTLWPRSRQIPTPPTTLQRRAIDSRVNKFQGRSLRRSCLYPARCHLKWAALGASHWLWWHPLLVPANQPPVIGRSISHIASALALEMVMPHAAACPDSGPCPLCHLAAVRCLVVTQCSRLGPAAFLWCWRQTPPFLQSSVSRRLATPNIG